MRLLHDDRFKKLSLPQPCGQWLWSYLLFGPKTIIVPGLLPVGLGTIAEDLRWPLPATKKAWQEIADQQMAVADFDAPLIWLPKAIYHNTPESLNTCKSWGRALVEDVPECALRARAAARIGVFLALATGPSFLKAFAQRLPQSLKDAIDEAIAQAKPQDLPEAFRKDFPEFMPDTETGAGTDPDPRSANQIAECASEAHVSADLTQGSLRLAVPKRDASRAAPTSGELHEFVLGYERRRAELRGTTLGRTPDRDWKLAKAFLRDMPDGDRRKVLVSNFLTTKAAGYPYDGARTLHQFLTHWQDVEAALIEAGILARVVPLPGVGHA